MPDRYQPVEFLAKDARLISRASSEKPGLRDYTVKRDFRRDYDDDIRREGFDFFWANRSSPFASDPGTQPFPWRNVTGSPVAEPITLVHLARRPNGKNAIIVGTQTKLWRFTSFENGGYFEGAGGSAYFEEAPALNAPYFQTNQGEWLLIGSGFSTSGHRWEAVNINGYVVLNNGVDLPMTYRIEEDAVVPIYELREQGIASVGTIAELSGILMMGDISEIQEEPLADLFGLQGDTDSGEVLASQSGTTVTTPVNFFTAAMVGRWIVWSDHTVSQITVYGSATSVTVSVSATKTDKHFTLRNKASQAGATFSGLITGTVTAADQTVTASSAFFNVGMVGKTIRFSDGFESTIASYTDTTHVEMTDAPTGAITALPFWISSATSYALIADGDEFTAGMVGRTVVFEDGTERKITAYTNAKTVTVDVDSAVASQFFWISPDAYAAYTDTSKIDRIQYKIIWAMIDEPRRFGAIVPGSITAGSTEVTLDYYVRSFEEGDEITILGAGTDGGNLSATILSISNFGGTLQIDTPAETTVTHEKAIMLTDAIGSIVGSVEIQDDGSGILRMMKLDRYLVVYKDTSIFLGRYTGNADNPFEFENLEVPDGVTLYYRWTLVNIGEHAHVYAGSNAFYRFDMTSRVPERIAVLESVADIFYAQAKLANTESIFAADSFVTNEVWFQFPSTTSDKGICFDYRYSTASTTSISITSGATVKRPVVGTSPGVTEDWFVMGLSDGTVVQYGRTDEPQSAWGDSKDIYYRRSGYPYSATKTAYQSDLWSGLEAFGDEYSEKDVRGIVPCLGSKSPSCTVGVIIAGTINTPNSATQLTNYSITAPLTKNLVPVFFRQIYFQQKLTITGIDNPCRITSWIYDVSGVKSRSHPRRP